MATTGAFHDVIDPLTGSSGVPGILLKVCTADACENLLMPDRLKAWQMLQARTTEMLTTVYILLPFLYCDAATRRVVQRVQ